MTKWFSQDRKYQKHVRCEQYPALCISWRPKTKAKSRALYPSANRWAFHHCFSPVKHPHRHPSVMIPVSCSCAGGSIVVLVILTVMDAASSGLPSTYNSRHTVERSFSMPMHLKWPLRVWGGPNTNFLRSWLSKNTTFSLRAQLRRAFSSPSS